MNPAVSNVNTYFSFVGAGSGAAGGGYSGGYGGAANSGGGGRRYWKRKFGGASRPSTFSDMPIVWKGHFWMWIFN